ncbi:MAG: hypothetical protein P4L55_03645 [Syntrophobacteraceae bacterium]|nr:hypothetical protein [Syntrophobacteraceae bacterium]
MPVNLYCKKCRFPSSLESKACGKCGASFEKKEDRQFLVTVSHKRVRKSQIVPSLTLARQVEAALKAEMIKSQYSIADHEVKEKPVTLGDVWERLLEVLSVWGSLVGRLQVRHTLRHLLPQVFILRCVNLSGGTLRAI